jgi:hypothetical protein
MTTPPICSPTSFFSWALAGKAKKWGMAINIKAAAKYLIHCWFTFTLNVLPV